MAWVFVDALEEGVDLDVGLGGGGQGPLGPVAGGAETTEGGLVALHRGSHDAAVKRQQVRYSLGIVVR